MHKISDSEEKRINALINYNILYTPEEQEFNELAELAANIFDMPISFISFIDEQKQWNKASYGLDLKEIDRKNAFCSTTIGKKDIFVVGNADEDIHFKNNKLVTEFPNIKFYAGAPIIDQNGFAIGALCVIDKKPRSFSEADKKNLAVLSKQIMNMLIVKVQLEANEKAIEALKDSERKFQNLSENSPDLIMRFNKEKQHIYVNKTTEKYSRFPAAQFIGKTHKDLGFNPQIAENLDIIIDEVFRTRNYKEIEVEFTSGRWFDWRLTPEFDEEGSIVSIMTTARDISERKKIEKLIKANEERTRLIIDTALEAIFTFDHDGVVTYWNAESEKSFGWKKEEIVGQRIDEILIPPFAQGLNRETIKRFFRFNMHKSTREIKAYKKNGQEFYIELAVSRVINNNEIIYTAFARDVTLRKLADAELKKTLQQEKELNELKNRFISMTSHEFRTPLTSILSTSELLEKYDGTLPLDKKKSMLNRVQNSAKTTISLLDDILMINKIESGKIRFNPQPMNLKDFVTEVAEDFKLMSGDKYLFEEYFNLRSEELLIDEKLMRQILTNLFSNAIKYSPKGGKIEYGFTEENSKLYFYIKDEGIGIPLEDKKNLFDSFFRAKNVSNIPGTGLGLAIVKHSVNAHNGSIKVESEENKGTHFTIEINL